MRFLIDHTVLDTSLVEGCPSELLPFGESCVEILRAKRVDGRQPTGNGRLVSSSEIDDDDMEMETGVKFGGFVGTSLETLRGLMDVKFGGIGEYCYRIHGLDDRSRSLSFGDRFRCAADAKSKV